MTGKRGILKMVVMECRYVRKKNFFNRSITPTLREFHGFFDVFAFFNDSREAKPKL